MRAICGLILLCTTAAGCMMDKERAPVATGQGEEQTQRLTTYSPWQKFCGKGKDPDASSLSDLVRPTHCCPRITQ
jgi:hypothetical protein